MPQEGGEQRMPEHGAEEVVPLIAAKQAAQIAMDYFRELYSSPYADLALEEIAENSFRYEWIVTIGYAMARRAAGGVGAVVVPNMPRQYKDIMIDSRTGSVKSMQVRKI